MNARAPLRRFDPDDYAGYAMAASLLPAYSRTPADSIVPLGLRAAKRAIEIDSNLADAHLGLANLFVWDLAWDKAHKEYERAIELEPMNASAQVQLPVGEGAGRRPVTV